MGIRSNVHVVLLQADYEELLCRYGLKFGRNLSDEICASSDFESYGHKYTYFFFEDIKWYTGVFDDITFIENFIRSCRYFEEVVISEENEFEVFRSDESEYFIEPTISVLKNWKTEINKTGGNDNE